MKKVSSLTREMSIHCRETHRVKAQHFRSVVAQFSVVVVAVLVNGGCLRAPKWFFPKAPLSIRCASFSASNPIWEGEEPCPIHASCYRIDQAGRNLEELETEGFYSYTLYLSRSHGVG